MNVTSWMFSFYLSYYVEIHLLLLFFSFECKIGGDRGGNSGGGKLICDCEKFLVWTRGPRMLK